MTKRFVSVGEESKTKEKHTYLNFGNSDSTILERYLETFAVYIACFITSRPVHNVRHKIECKILNK